MKKVILGLAIGLMASSAFADTNYIGGGFGRTAMADDAAPSFNVVIGHEIQVADQFGLALESGYTKFGDLTGTVDGTTGTLDMYGIPVKLKPTYHQDKFSVAPYVGATWLHGDLTGDLSGSGDDTFMTYGLDIGYDVDEVVTLKVGYNYIDADVEGYSLPMKTINAQVVFKI